MVQSANSDDSVDRKWNAPSVSANATVIDLGKAGGKTYWSFADDEDVVFINSTGSTQNVLTTNGGRNIVVLGGEFAPDGSRKSAAAIYMANVHGDVFIEGVHIDNGAGGERDGIALYGAGNHKPAVTIQNSLIENVSGSRGGFHGDVFQAHGAIKSLNMYNVTGSTNYQGIFLDPQYGSPPDVVNLENVNLKFVAGAEKYPTLYWFYSPTSSQIFPVNLKNVFVQEPANNGAELTAVWPKQNVRTGDEITWPDLPIRGWITVGNPNGGDYTGKGQIGANFDYQDILSDMLAPMPGYVGTSGADKMGGTAAADIMLGGDGNDTLSGKDGNDTLDGGRHNDRLDGGVGADMMIGGDGNDTYVIDNAGDTIQEWVNGGKGGVDTVESSIDYTLGANLENLTLTGTSNLKGIGNALDNVILGNAGANRLEGGAGDDTLSGKEGKDTLDGGWGNDRLDGGAGADAMIGGDGNDVYVVDNNGDTIQEWINSGKGGVDTVESSIDYTLGLNIENLTLLGGANLDGVGNAAGNVITGNSGANRLDGAAGNDTLLGKEGDDSLFGGSGADALDGGWGNDRIDGGAGADTLIGGDGNDVYVVDNAGDTIREWVNGGKGGVDTVESWIDYTLGLNLENLTLLGASNLKGAGNALDNVITGNSGGNRIDGGAGHDTLSGREGNDTLDGGWGNDRLDGGVGADVMIGGDGNDIYTVDNAGDTIQEWINSGKGGIDTVRSGIDYTLGINLENLSLIGTSNRNGVGNNLNNVIDGNWGANRLEGGAGNDTLDGRGGKDTLVGGAGADTFVFTRLEAAGDTILDFSGGSGQKDKILLFGYGDGASVEHRSGSIWWIESSDGTHDQISIVGAVRESDFSFV